MITGSCRYMYGMEGSKGDLAEVRRNIYLYHHRLQGILLERVLGADLQARLGYSQQLVQSASTRGCSSTRSCKPSNRAGDSLGTP